MTLKRKPNQGEYVDVYDEEKKTAANQFTRDDRGAEEQGDGSSDPVETIKEELEQAQQEAKDAYDRFLRVSAEFENYKKRAARETDDFRRYANERLIKELLPVIDNLERAIASADSADTAKETIVEGVHLTLQEINRVLERFNVTTIEAIERPFDPAFHQAVMQEETAGPIEPTVLKELQKGYLLHDRLLRPSMVVVSKTTDSREAPEDRPEGVPRTETEEHQE